MTLRPARLNQPRTKVLCWRRECGTTLAYIARPTTDRYLAFRPGWVQRREDGAWVLSEHATKRWLQGRDNPTFRGREPAFRRGFRDAPTHATVPRGGNLAGVLVTEFPATVKCPNPGCGWMQILDADVLDVRPPDDAPASLAGGTPYIYRKPEQPSRTTDPNQ